MIRFEPREIIPQNEYPDRDHIVTLSPPISFKVETLLNSCEMPVVNLQNTGETFFLVATRFVGDLKIARF